MPSLLRRRREKCWLNASWKLEALQESPIFMHRAEWRERVRLCENSNDRAPVYKFQSVFRPFPPITGSVERKSSLLMRRFQTISEFSHSLGRLLPFERSHVSDRSQRSSGHPKRDNMREPITTRQRRAVFADPLRSPPTGRRFRHCAGRASGRRCAPAPLRRS